jgi:hypothetical protein
MACTEVEMFCTEVEMLGVGSVFGLTTLGQPSMTTLEKAVKASSLPNWM